MKKLFALIGGIISLAASAQTITITFNGATQNRNYQVVLDGTSYYSNSSANAGNRNATVKQNIILDNQQLGSHTLAVYRMRTNSGTYDNGSNTAPIGRALYSNTFQLREGYDMDIRVNASGNVTFREKRIRARGNMGRAEPMADASFKQLVQDVSVRRVQSQRFAIVRDAFTNVENYFTTLQARQLLILITGEANRLALAKIAYPRVTDPANFTMLYDIFSRVQSRDEMNAFIRNNPNTNGNSNNSSQNNGNTGNTYRTPVADYQFNQLVQNINNQYNQASKYSIVRGAFNTTSNYYSSGQVRQILVLMSTESDRLALAKLSYSRLSDPANFNIVYDLFYNQSSKNEMSNFVMQSGATGMGNTTGTRIAMADYQFNELVQNVNSQYSQLAKYNQVRDAFNTTVNYYSSGQVRQLIALITSETDRLSLAKLSYARVSDPANFTTIYDLFYNQSSKNELNNFVMQGGSVGTGTSTSTRIAITDDAFTQVLQKARNHFFPWDVVRDVNAAFNNTSYYFNTSQIRQLLSLITSQSERLASAKLSWRTVTDPANFTTLYDLFTTQASRDDLNNYITSHPSQ